jgi:hypothetical protein
MGLFYVDRKARRKWVYALLALFISLLILTQIFYEMTRAMNVGRFRLEKMAEGRIDNALEGTLLVFLGVYVLSFADVLGTCYLYHRKYAERSSEVRSFRRDWKGKVPSLVNQVSDERRTEQVSTIGQAKNPTNRLKRSVQRLLAWNKSPAFIRVIGILPFLLFLFLNSSLTSGLADLFASLSIVWFLVAVFIAERIAKLENSGSVSTEKELKPPKTITK